ncbi:MAG: sigma-70 family RNA polymerase sigma factor [Bacteroidetes bacterium]|nr:sigma-70 family RNA polymerase sigma factor [Bacteroidota bacterium]
MAEKIQYQAGGTDEELMLRFINGDNKAFDELVRRYMDSVISYLYNFTGDYNLSDDIAQESFIRLYRYKDRYDENSKFSPWFYSIVINRAKSAMQVKTDKEHISLNDMNNDEIGKIDLVSDPSDNDDLEEYEYLNEVKIEYIKKAFEVIDPLYKEAIILRFMKEMEYEMIAEILNIPVGTVKSRISRGRSQIKEIISKNYNV